MRRCMVIFMICRLMMGAFCSAAGAESLVIAGTGDSQILLRKLAALYEKNKQADEIIVPDSVGSGGGIKAVINGTAGLARTARTLKTKEKHHSLSEIPMAYSPIVFVGHPGVAKVKNLTTENILKIYNGTVTNWRELGGDDHKIYPIDREPGDSSRKILEVNLTSAAGTFKAIKSKAKVIYSTPETMQAIARNQYAIGYLPLSIAQEVRLHVFLLNGVFPDEKCIQSNAYPLVTTFYLVKPADPSEPAKAFLSFIREKPAQSLMLSSGVIPFGLNKP